MKKINTTTLVGVLIAVVAAALLISGVIMFIAGNRQSEPESSKTTEPSTAATLPTSAHNAASGVPATLPQPTEAETDIPQEDSTVTPDLNPQENLPATAAALTVPENMQALLDEGGVSAADLAARDIRQLVVVNSSGTAADISFFEAKDGAWKHRDSLNCSGNVGAMGTVSPTVMGEDVSGTPQGLYPVGEAFYQNDMPVTGLRSFKITPDTYWVDDPTSEYYNQRVVGTDNQDWFSAEPMADISGYRYGFVIEYNTNPIIAGSGSAIFFHIGSGSTGGCVSTSEEMVLQYLAALDAAENPYILIL